MEAIFPFEKLDGYYELAIKEVCNRYRWYLEDKLPRNFNNWFVIKDYQNEDSSYNHFVNCPERNYSDTMLKLKNNINIVINLQSVCVTHIPSPNKNFDYSKYNDEHQYVTCDDYKSLQEKFPYMFTKNGTIKFSIDASYAIYVCTHEWMHTLTYVDWDNSYNSDYMWFIELQTDVRALNFLHQNVNEINELFSDFYSDGKQFEFEMHYIEEISRSGNSYIRGKIPPCIFE